MNFDCGHSGDRGVLTGTGLLCDACFEAKEWPSKRLEGDFHHRKSRQRKDQMSEEIRKAHKRLRKRLPVEWPDEMLFKIASRIVHRQTFEHQRTHGIEAYLKVD